MIPFRVFATGVNPMVATITPKIVPEMKLNMMSIRASQTILDAPCDSF
jgi:hypothetical protein